MTATDPAAAGARLLTDTVALINDPTVNLDDIDLSQLLQAAGWGVYIAGEVPDTDSVRLRLRLATLVLGGSSVDEILMELGFMVRETAQPGAATAPAPQSNPLAFLVNSTPPPQPAAPAASPTVMPKKAPGGKRPRAGA